MRRPEQVVSIYPESTAQVIDRPLSRSLREKVDFILKGALVSSVVGSVITYAFSTMPGPEKYTTLLQNASEGLLMASALFTTSLLAINITQRTVREWMVFTQGQEHPHP